MAAPAPKLLPDRMADTRGAGQIIAVTNDGVGTDATLRAYQRSGSHWTQVFGPFAVKIGAGGFSHTVSEQTVASPIGYFTLTQAFGNDSDPGTKLPYHHVAYGDVWVSQTSSPHYNTLQVSDSDGARGTGEKLWEVVPEYDYGVVIDYNRAPIQPGAGSAFFVHVTDGRPTAGCVSMPVNDLLPLMRWLDPAQAPRIAMGPETDVLGL
jgi:L,D-peptidoglycan transpeptidase YkuD (ErfK/YbiS/YcfS/YnhG family)